MYEKISDRLIPAEKFARRMLTHSLLVILIMALSVSVGAVGFIVFENRSLEDAVLNSAFMLSGSGLVEVPASFAGKLFAGIYGLYASIFFLAAFSIIFAPIVHRILHKLHLDSDDDPQDLSAGK
jgi:hypothetical protein